VRRRRSTCEGRRNCPQGRRKAATSGRHLERSLARETRRRPVLRANCRAWGAGGHVGHVDQVEQVGQVEQVEQVGQVDQVVQVGVGQV